MNNFQIDLTTRAKNSVKVLLDSFEVFPYINEKDKADIQAIHDRLELMIEKEIAFKLSKKEADFSKPL